MIVARLFGGLGNQLFQYAAGRALAARLGVDLVLDSRWLDGRGSGPPASARRYYLGCFDHGAPLLDVSRIARVPPRTRLDAYAQRLLPSFGKPTLSLVVQRGDGVFDARLLSAPDDTYIIGSWEDERYFADRADVVRRQLRWRLAEPRLERLVEEIGGQHAVSVHVRRGDKVTDAHAARTFRELSGVWFAAAFELLCERVSRIDRVYVFSDDPDWCRRHVVLPVPVDVIGGNAAEDDLRLMSACRHHIICNSTFGWWGAWLNPSGEKIVIAPLLWRYDRPAVDLPAGWLRLPNEASPATGG